MTDECMDECFERGAHGWEEIGEGEDKKGLFIKLKCRFCGKETKRYLK